MTKNALEEVGHAGARVREKRISAGIKQAELASQVGISPSYLNLIEHNRRRIGGKLLSELAGALAVDTQFLSDGAEADLIASLHDVSVEKVASDTLGQEAGRIEEFAEKFPGWARMIAMQRGRISQLQSIIDGLNDRLTHDPVLSETMHDVLSTASAIRSTASILVATPDIDADWRQRFHSNIDAESRRLAETSAAMAEHFEHLTHSSATYVTPLESTQALFARFAYHFPTIEADGVAAIDDILASEELQGGETERMVRGALTDYAHRAAKLSVEDAFNALRKNGLAALDQLSFAYAMPLDDVLLRLGELPHNPEFPEMGCVQTDGAGALLVRNQIAGFTIPRFGAACNLWPVFTALATPGQAMQGAVKTNEGVCFSTYSIAIRMQPPSFDAAPVYRSTMLIVAGGREDHAHDIGPACRVCPKHECDARREPSILDSFAAL